MISGIFIIIFLLGLIIFFNSVMFWFLLDRRIYFLQSVKIMCIAFALNKLLFAGSGYAALSFKLKRESIPVYKSLSAFGVIELFSVIPWLVLGFYFGAQIAVKVNVVWIIIAVFAALLVVTKKKEISVFLKNSVCYFKEVKLNMLLIFPLVFFNMGAFLMYYFFLFKIFAFKCSLLDIFKIVSVSFTVGYLSPIPSGVGLKDGSLLFFLLKRGFSISDSLSFVVSDRLIFTGFYLALGFLFGADMILEQVRKRILKQP